MPYNILGEAVREGCRCDRCRVARRNLEITGGQVFTSGTTALREYRNHVTRAGPMTDYYGNRVSYDDALQRFHNNARTFHDMAPEMSASERRQAEEDRRRIREAESQRQARDYARRAAMTPEERLLEDHRNAGDPRHNYTHKPRWQKFGAAPPYFGLELEVTCNDFGVMGFVNAQVARLGFLKRDSSVAGFELVTHPMSFPWAMEGFPWKLLTEMERLGCTIMPETNGLHVHVSRDGFASPSHQLRWLKFIYRNRQQVSRLARRRSRYGTFKEAAQAGQLTHIQMLKAREAFKDLERKFQNEGTFESQEAYERAAEELHRIQANDPTILERYAAINTRNDATYELRMFAASLRVLEVKAAIQFAAATVEYTRNLTAHEVCEGGWGWLAFSSWLRANRSTYPELLKANQLARESKGPAAAYTLASAIRAGM